MSALARCFAILTGLAVPGVVAAPSDTVWPEVEMPSGARAITVAADLVLDGKPCRVVRFEVGAALNDVLQFYRAQFRATHVVETHVRDQPVVATRRGDHFHTIQLRSVANAVQATIITTALRAGPLASAASRDTAAWMPADTAVVWSLQSKDAGRRSLMVIGVNHHSVDVNRAHLVAALRQRGFRLLRDDPTASPRPGSDGREAVSLSLASASEQATLTIADAGPYRSVLVQRTVEAQP